MAKSIGREIADQFQAGESRLADAVDAAVVAARTEEARAWRQRLAAVVVECGVRRGSGPYRLTVSQRSIRAVAVGGTPSDAELPEGARLLTYSEPRSAPRSIGLPTVAAG